MMGMEEDAEEEEGAAAAAAAAAPPDPSTALPNAGGSCVCAFPVVVDDGGSGSGKGRWWGCPAPVTHPAPWCCCRES